MNILGITAEYDPFHNGHRYHLRQAREKSGADAVICAMSGDFTQRGEPAILDKWERARIAIDQGIDLVLELPFSVATGRAERFARGAVDLLVKAGASAISFGCEAEHPEDLVHLARLQLSHREELLAAAKPYRDQGYSYAKAMEFAGQDLFGSRLTELSLSPNNILALEYLKRMILWEHQGIKVRSVPVLRQGSGYKERVHESGFAGGSMLRVMLEKEEDISSYIPYAMPEALDQKRARQRIYLLLRGTVLGRKAEQIAEIYGVGEGLEHRILKAVRRCESMEEFLSFMVSRRYTAAAIRRIVLNILLGVRKTDGKLPEEEAFEEICYARVLGANEAGRKVLRQVEELILISGQRGSEYLPEKVRQGLDLDSRSADLYHLLGAQPLDGEADYRKRPYMAG